MTARVKRLAIATLAAAIVTVGSLAATSTASALPMSCNVAANLYKAYMTTGHAFTAIGATVTAAYWYGRAVGIIELACL